MSGRCSGRCAGGAGSTEGSCREDQDSGKGGGERGRRKEDGVLSTGDQSDYVSSSSSPPPQAVVEGVLQGAEQLRPAMEKLMQTSEQHGYILQEEHCAGCIALLKTHIQHLKSVPTQCPLGRVTKQGKCRIYTCDFSLSRDKIASLQQAEEELEGTPLLLPYTILTALFMNNLFTIIHRTTPVEVATFIQCCIIKGKGEEGKCVTLCSLWCSPVSSKRRRREWMSLTWTGEQQMKK